MKINVMNFKYYCKTKIIVKMGMGYYKRELNSTSTYIQSRENCYKYECNLMQPENPNVKSFYFNLLSFYVYQYM